MSTNVFKLTGMSHGWLEFNTDDMVFRLCIFWSMLSKAPPYEGDFIDVDMRSGETARFVVDSYDRPSDPGDQFFYVLKFVEYI